MKSVYHKLLIICMCLVIVPALIVGVVLYTVSVNNIKHQVSQANIDMLNQYGSKVEMLLKEVDILSSQGVLEYGQYREYSQWNVKELIDMVASIRAKSTVNDIIDSIYLYYPSSGKIMVNDTVWSWNEFYDKSWEKIYKNADIVNDDKPLWIYDRNIKSPLKGMSSVITVIRAFPFRSLSKYGYFVVNIKKETFFNTIGQNVNNIMILDNDGNVIKGNDFMRGWNFSGYMMPESNGFFEYKDNKSSIMVSYSVSRYNGWKYFSTIDNSVLLGPIDAVRRTLLAIAILCFIGAVIASFLVSSKISLPIRKLVLRLNQVRFECESEVCDDANDGLCNNDEISMINRYIDRILNDRENIKNMLSSRRKSNAGALRELTSEPEKAVSSNSDVIATVKNYIAVHYNNKDLTLGSMADSLHISASYLGDLFKKETGMGFSEFLIALRMEKAKELLETTGKSIRQVSDSVGYSSDHSFYCMFKQYTGISPTAYRKSRSGDILGSPDK